MGDLIRLQPRERAAHDNEVIAVLYRSLGQAAAEALIDRATAELSLTLLSLSARIRRHELQNLPAGLRKLRAMAENLGMTGLAKVAGDARLCLERADGTGFAATWSRLLRLSQDLTRPEKDSADRSV